MAVSARWLVCLLVWGCGRVGFDDVAVTGDDAAPGTSTLTYPSGDVNAVLNVTSVSLVPTYTGTPSFSIMPSLPAGLVLDARTGEISGVPTAVVDDVTYDVTATIGGTTATATFDLTVLPGFVVDATADGFDDDGGNNNVCFSSAAGGCSLRAAFDSVNQKTTKQLVLLGAGTYVITSQTTLNVDLVIAGAGAALTHIWPVSNHPGNRFLQLTAPRSLALKRLSADNFGTTDGAVAWAQGGLVLVDACSFTNNAASSAGGVFYFFQGAKATIRRSTFTDNQATPGMGWGGVIDGEGSNTTIVVGQSTAIHNTAVWGSFSHITTGTTLLLENSTLYNNLSLTAGTLATPGGIYTLVNDTIVGNTNTNLVPDSAGIYLFNAPCHYNVSNTIVAFNRDVTGAPHNCNRRDLTTSLTSGGGNVFSDDAENCGTYFTAAGDRLMTDPQIVAGSPTDNGGKTQTIMPTPTSLVLGAGQQCPPVDQRGMTRPASGCDVGAVELP